MSSGRKLAICMGIMAGAMAYFVYYGVAGGWQYYLTVDECASDAGCLIGTRIRVSGKVAQGSLRVADDRSRAEFALDGDKGKLGVRCKGPIPENLAEKMDVVVEGRLRTPVELEGEKVLTRCASKYESNNGAAEPRDGPARKSERSK
jgi:cytochrome c-type biogenesis protein CcmE